MIIVVIIILLHKFMHQMIWQKWKADNFIYEKLILINMFNSLYFHQLKMIVFHF